MKRFFSFYILFIINVMLYSQVSGQTFSVGNLENVIAMTEVAILKNDTNCSYNESPTLKVYLCAVDNAPQTRHNANVHKGRSYLILTYKDIGSPILLPHEGDILNIDTSGDCVVDWSYEKNGTTFIYIMLTTGLFESQINLKFGLGDVNPIAKVSYEIKGSRYIFENDTTLGNDTRMKDFIDFKKKLISFYSNKH